MATGFNIRVGDADREATAAELREHYASGRLTLEELNERLDQAFAAKTRADLNTVMRDLPSAGRAAAGAPLASSGVGGSGSGYRSGPRDSRGSGGGWAGWGQATGAAAAFMSLLWGLLVVVGVVLALGFGIGGGRPIIIVLVLAALAVLRRLFFRRRAWARGRGCGQRGPRW